MFVQKEQTHIEHSSIEWENAGEGIRRKVMAYGDTAMGVFVEFNKGAIGYLHKHPHVQISFIHAGKFEVQIGGENKILNKGDWYYAPSNIEHGVVALEDGVLIDFFSPLREDFLKK
jgi:quercetin dioxygenase-like cupin family protein